MSTFSGSNGGNGKRLGAPPYYDSPEAMQARIDAYFEACDTQCDSDGKPTPAPYTVPDLALALGFSSRQSLLEYQGKPDFGDTVKMAKLRIEGQRNRNMVAGKGNPVGAIFDLKNNFGWIDAQTVQVQQHLSVELVDTRLRMLTQANPELLDLIQDADIVEDSDDDEGGSHAV